MLLSSTGRFEASGSKKPAFFIKNLRGERHREHESS